MKIFLAFVLMVAAVAALPASKNSARIPLNCKQVINDDFTFRWGIERDRIEFEIQANTTGWVGLAMADASPAVLVGDIWMGGYDDVTGQSYLEVYLLNTFISLLVIKNHLKILDQQDRFLDLSLNPPPNGGVLDQRASDLTLESAIYAAPWTILRFSRLLDTRDPEDLQITVNNALYNQMISYLYCCYLDYY